MDPKDFKQSVPRAIERYKNVWNSFENNRDIRERNVTLHTKNASFTEISVRCRYCSNSSTQEHIVYVSHTWSHTWLRGGLRWGVDQSKRTLFLAFPHVTTRRLICIKFDNSSTSIEWYYGLRKPLPTTRRFFIHFPFKFAIDTDPLIKKKKIQKIRPMNENLKTKAATWMGGPNGAYPFSIEKKKKKKKIRRQVIEELNPRSGPVPFFFFPTPHKTNQWKTSPPLIGGRSQRLVTMATARFSASLGLLNCGNIFHRTKLNFFLFKKKQKKHWNEWKHW